MKKLSNDFNSDIIINNKNEYSIIPSFISINKKYNKYVNNNNRNNNYNYNYNTEIFPKKNKKMKRIKNEGKYSQKTYDIENSLSNIKKQLNNVSINEKNILKIQTNKNSNSNSLNKFYNFSTKKVNTFNNLLINNKKELGKKNLVVEINHISFSILKSTSGKYDLISKNKELQNENTLLKENIKFLLSQIKKYKKNEFKNKINELPKAKEDITEKNINDKKLEKNKINNVFDIINKYKKEILTLKSKLKYLTQQNEELKELISNKDNTLNLYDNNSFKNMNHFHKKDSIIKKPKIKNNALFNHKLYYHNQRNTNKDNLTLYKKKTFNKTFSSFKRNSYNSYTNEKYNNERFIQTFTNTKNNIFDSEEKNLNYTDKNNNIFDKFNSKIKHLIIIDSEFTGEEKIENQINTFKKNRKINYRNFNNKYNNENAHSTSINNDLYFKKTIDSSKLKKIYFDETFKRQTLFKEYNTLNSENI